MHETGLAIEIARLAIDALEGDGTRGRVKSLHIKVGRWSGVEPETLKFALTVVCDGTELEGATAEIEVVEPTFKCAVCGLQYVAKDRFDTCPACGGPPGEMTGGDELTLTHMDIED